MHILYKEKNFWQAKINSEFHLYRKTSGKILFQPVSFEG